MKPTLTILVALLFAPMTTLHAADTTKQKPNNNFLLSDNQGGKD
jgi:hypothetical protein